jgi:type 1 glutamine amidotransferase
MGFEHRLNRRSAITLIGAGITALTAGRMASGNPPQGAVRFKGSALALCGDESHNSDYIRTALTSTLVDDAGLSIDFTDQEKLLTYQNLRNYKILIMFRDGLRFPHGYYEAMYWTGKPEDIVSFPPLQKTIGGGRVGWMTEEQGKGIKTWVEEGGSLWAFHNNSQASIMNKDYRDVEGAIYTGHPPIRPYKVHIVNREHPITKGVNDFIVTDEQHFVQYDKDPKYVLARSINENGLEYTDTTGHRSNTAESVWAYDYGKGRVCFMAPGHMIVVLWNPEYVKMQLNAAKWLLHES